MKEKYILNTERVLCLQIKHVSVLLVIEVLTYYKRSKMFLNTVLE